MQIARHAAAFDAASVESMGRVGQLDFYLPERLRPLGHLLDRAEMGLRLPGSVLFVWLRK